jgi:hypothetical protein
MRFGSPRFRLAMLLASFMGLVSRIDAQTHQVVTGSASCRNCVIELRRERTLGGDRGPAALGEIADVVVLANGSYAITHGGEPESVSIFSEAGRFVRSVGRAGRGPGEFRYALYVRPRGDGLLVIDPAARRAVVFDARFAPRSTIALTGEVLGAPILLDNGHIAVNALVRTQDRIGLLVHMVDTAGGIVRSIAPHPGGFRFDLPGETYFRSLAPTTRGSFWVAGRTRYQLDEYSAAGDLLRTFERAVDWFPAHTAGDARLDPKRPKQPRLIGIREDERGRIWTVTRTASVNWSRVLKPRQGVVSPMEQSYSFESLDQLYDTVVEVIDGRTGQLLASRTFDAALGHFIGGSKVVSYGENANGDALVHVWSLQLTETARR